MSFDYQKHLNKLQALKQTQDEEKAARKRPLDQAIAPVLEFANLLQASGELEDVDVDYKEDKVTIFLKVPEAIPVILELHVRVNPQGAKWGVERFVGAVASDGTPSGDYDELFDYIIEEIISHRKYVGI